jgi:hypothetical protein
MFWYLVTMTDYLMNGLVKRRSELAGGIANTHDLLRKLVSDIETLDKTIH